MKFVETSPSMRICSKESPSTTTFLHPKKHKQIISNVQRQEQQREKTGDTIFFVAKQIKVTKRRRSVCWIKEEMTKVVTQITKFGDERRKWVWFGLKREKEERES